MELYAIIWTVGWALAAVATWKATAKGQARSWRWLAWVLGVVALGPVLFWLVASLAFAIFLPPGSSITPL